MKKMFLKLCIAVICFVCFQASYAQSSKQPNFIIILADDLGYGDLSCYGHPTIRTPYLDKMASEGIRFTQFYVGANVCTPSRAALLTGRLPIRNGIYGEHRVVFYPNSSSGLPHSEITIAQALKQKNYKTAIIGKWHLGHLPEYLPLNYGFDYYFGIPYSNDMGKVNIFTSMNPPLPLIRNNEVIEVEPDQRLLTKRYTEEVIHFIKENKKKPFFIYYANNFPHIPIYASDDFRGKSRRGLYGDVVQELDWSVGQVLNALKEEKLDKNTFVIFLSDNGPWLYKDIKEEGGSAGLLYEGKGSTWEGGMRVPAIAWWPGTIHSNIISESVLTAMDLFPTIANMAHVQVPAADTLDGVDMSDILFQKKQEVRDIVYYYEKHYLYAVRKGKWKAHFTTHPSYSPEPPKKHQPPLLYNIEEDPSEKYEVGKEHPDIVADLQKEYEKQLATVKPAEGQLDKIIQKPTKK
jgi:arylsulfatase